MEQSQDTTEKKRSGKRLIWSDDKFLALEGASTIDCIDPTVGANMSGVQLARKKRSEFIKDHVRSEKVCKTVNDGKELDTRLWDGREYDT